MPGSPEVVQPLPPSRSRMSGHARADRPGESVPPTEPEARSSGGISKVAWAPQGDLDQSEWLATGRRLGAIGRCSQWWIGDWIRYGTARWGERYVEAARVTGYDVATLRNMAWVASQFDLSLRSDKLTWSHHVLLAPLDPDEQRRWLAHAREQRLSVADLRTELRRTRGAEAKALGSPAAEARPSTPTQVCPHCGHELGKPTD
jgi:hypothetical protein